MKTAIIYTSKHGTTEKVADLLAQKIGEASQVELFSLNKNPNPAIDDFDTVILGAAMYVGQPSGKMKTFCQSNEPLLLQKRMGLFVCGMEPDKSKREKELADAYAQPLFQKAQATGFLGGAFLFEKMNIFERMIIKKIAKTSTSVQRIDLEAINGFISQLM